MKTMSLRLRSLRVACAAALAAFCLLTAFTLGGCSRGGQLDTLSFAPNSDHSSTTPAPGTMFDWWPGRVEEINKRNAQGNVNLIFVGDSITHLWDRKSGALWETCYEPLGAVNMGFCGDRTEHVLWRFEHGNLDGIAPKAAVVMIGTNNTGADEPEEIADGIVAVCRQLRTRLPKTQILLLAIFPRDEKPTSALRQKVDRVNELIAPLGREDMITFLNINDVFLDDDGTLPAQIMPDFLHPEAEGYRRWAEAMQPTLERLMEE